MSNQNDYFSNLLAQQSSLSQFAWPPMPNPHYGITGGNVPNTTPPEAEAEFNLVLLTGDDDEA